MSLQAKGQAIGLPASQTGLFDHSAHRVRAAGATCKQLPKPHSWVRRGGQGRLKGHVCPAWRRLGALTGPRNHQRKLAARRCLLKMRQDLSGRPADDLLVQLGQLAAGRQAPLRAYYGHEVGQGGHQAVRRLEGHQGVGKSGELLQQAPAVRAASRQEAEIEKPVGGQS